MNTRYEIRAVSRNADYPYDQILKDFNMTMPDSYSIVCKELTYEEMDRYLNSDAPTDLPDYGYVPVPRGSSSAPDSNDLPEINVPTPEYSAPPEDLPPIESDIAPFDITSSGESDSGDDIDDVKF